MDRASQTEAVLQKKDLFSSSVSTNSVDIDNPVPQEGGLEKVSGAIKKYLLLTLRCADQQRDATHELVRDRFRSLFRCHAIEFSKLRLTRVLGEKGRWLIYKGGSLLRFPLPKTFFRATPHGNYIERYIVGYPMVESKAN